MTLDGKPTIAMGVFLQTGANALEVASSFAPRCRTEGFSRGDGLRHPLRHDALRLGVDQRSGQDLVEAMVLVLAVVFIFLQSWRQLIPMVAVPISLIGTFAGLWLFGFRSTR